MITQLQAKNFKSWADTGLLRIAPLTGFFGSNSSGKTSLLQILLLLKQTAAHDDPKMVLFLGDRDSLVNLGTFYDVVHNHEVEQGIDVFFSWFSANPQTWQKAGFNGNFYERHAKEAASLNVMFRQLGKKIVAVSIDHKMQGFSLEIKQDETSYELSLSDVAMNTNSKLEEIIAARISEPYKFYGVQIDNRILKIAGNNNELNFLILSNFNLQPEEQLSQIHYLGPLRQPPEHTYLWAGDKPSNVGTRGERIVSAFLSAQADNPQHTVKQKVGEWLQKMGLIHSFRLAPLSEEQRIYTLRVQQTPTSAEVNITSVGFGVSQILPVLVLCYYVPEGSTLILEQPEIHLHPRVQADLADVLIDVVKNRRIQIILESHSEYLLHRLQRRMAEEKLLPEDTALYFCRMGATSSEIEPLQVDEYGNILNYPPDFFGDDMGDMIARTEAQMKRQIKAL
jgi:predicted ATPase